MCVLFFIFSDLWFPCWPSFLKSRSSRSSSSRLWISTLKVALSCAMPPSSLCSSSMRWSFLSLASSVVFSLSSWSLKRSFSLVPSAWRWESLVCLTMHYNSNMSSTSRCRNQKSGARNWDQVSLTDERHMCRLFNPDTHRDKQPFTLRFTFKFNCESTNNFMNVFGLWTETGHNPTPLIQWFGFQSHVVLTDAPPPHLGFFPLNRIITLQHKQVWQWRTAS